MTCLISNFRRVLYVVCFLLGNSPASEFYMQTFRNTLFHLQRQEDLTSCLWRWTRWSVSKRRHIKSRRRGITQKKTYNNDMFVCKPFSHLVLFKIFVVGNMNAETAEHLRGCRNHAGRMFCRRAGGRTIFWTCTGRERGLWEEDVDANTSVKFLDCEVKRNIKNCA
jgi:hypothetical protein